MKQQRMQKLYDEGRYSLFWALNIVRERERTANVAETRKLYVLVGMYIHYKETASIWKEYGIF
jgi:hypothetical protein